MASSLTSTIGNSLAGLPLGWAKKLIEPSGLRRIWVTSQLCNWGPKPIRATPSISPPRGSVHISSAQLAPSSIIQVPASSTLRFERGRNQQ